MAKLSDRQKNNIFDKWNTGSYTKTQLAKAYKVSEKTIRDIVGKEKPTNSHFVEAGVFLETAKKSEKSPNEIKAINQAIKYELDSLEYKQNNKVLVHDSAKEVLGMIMDKLKNGKASKVITEGLGDGMSRGAEIEFEHQIEHYDKAINAIEKTAKIFGVIEDKASVQIANQNQQEVNNQNLEVVYK